LVALSTLPAIWVDHDGQQIADSVAEALVGILGLEFVYVSAATTGTRRIEVTRVANRGGADHSEQVRASLAFWIGSSVPIDAVTLENPVGTGSVRVFFLPVGFPEPAMIVAASRSPDFPSQTERLLLTVTANQMAIALRRRGAEEAVRQSEERFRQLADELPQIVWMAQPNGHVDYYNQRWYDFTGFPEGQTGFEGWRRLLHPTDLRPSIETWKKSVQSGQRYKIEYRFFDRISRQYRWYLGRALPVRDADGTISRWFGTCTDIDEQKRAAEALQGLTYALEDRVADRARQLATTTARLEESEHRFQLLVDGVTDYAIFMLDPAGNVVSWNPGAERIKGYSTEEIIGQHFSRFYTEYDRQQGLPATALATAERTGKYEAEGFRVRKNGTTFVANVVINAIRDPSGDLLGFAKITRDITQKKAVEDQLRQAQKMEAVGHLTGGVAHDFNNLLTVIMGNLEHLERILLPTQPSQRIIAAALRATSRAAILTHRLLAFSRRQPLMPEVLSVNKLVAGMSDLLRRTLGEAIFIETVLAGGLWPTLADSNQLENALINLAINARDAMPDGGKLTIETANTHLDDGYARMHAQVEPGQYVGIFVTDTGIGMSAETAFQAFEPFFTTKEIGQGTGLGLSQVYGFIKQSGGHVKIYSEVGEGTTVKLYLPRHLGAEDVTDDRQETRKIPQGRSELVLVVEDDPDVRDYTLEMVGDLGYSVLSAPDGASALRLLDSNREVSLLFTDVGLPGGMNGRQLAEQALRRQPRLKVLYTTGYARNAIVHQGRLDPGVEVIFKPFTYSDLAKTIRRVLDD
jgi:PAS domain S-box-containing protein